MKLKLCSFVILSALAITPVSSIASVVHLTNKDYVDTGLRAVYNRAKAVNNETQNNLDVLTLYVGNPTTATEEASGLTAQVEDLTAAVNSMESYEGDDRGVLVTEGKKIEIDGLDEETKTDDKIYVFKNNTATELDVADTWSVPEVENN
ncbi:MAG: hypothetical protein J6S57_02610 [Alphaproteobacteria bacterium]|nr:hypothetical protein [Alphaproteobacteria bacterium]